MDRNLKSARTHASYLSIKRRPFGERELIEGYGPDEASAEKACLDAAEKAGWYPPSWWQWWRRADDKTPRTGIHIHSTWEPPTSCLLATGVDGPGLPIAKLKEAPVATRQVMRALQLIGSGSYDAGARLLTAGRTLDSEADSWVIQASGKHAFVLSELLALAHKARAAHALPPKEAWSWLASVDARLHALLSDIGKPVQSAACAAVVGHYLLEKRHGGPIEPEEAR
ncbi:hypothetical protein ABIC83_002843 [Roseateles asaccharophilus]|uniref:secretion/conjugation apparatus DotM-related subunit n=1 Tax=Roseateles asaccharophilus TaxID=582607 RepID=UPI0038347226